MTLFYYKFDSYTAYHFMEVIAKYPIKIGKILVPKGAIGIIATLEEVRKIWPNIGVVEGSTQIGIKFLDLDVCIVHKNQLIFS